MTLLTTRPISFPLPEPEWLPRFMRIDIWAVNILEPHLMSVSVRVNTFLAEDRCWSYLHWKCGALAFFFLPLQHLCHLSAAHPTPPPSAACFQWEEWESEEKAKQRLPGMTRAGWAGRALQGTLGVDAPSLQHPDAGLPMPVSTRIEFLWARWFPFPNPGKPPIPAVLDK